MLEALTRGLASDETQRRTGAVLALARSPDPRAFEALAAQCRTRNFAFRWLVAEAIGKAGNLRFKDKLLAALKDKDWHVREVAVVALGAMHEAVGIEPLLQCLKSEDPYIRKLTCFQLGAIGDPRAIDGLINDILKKYDTYTLRTWGSIGIWLITNQLDKEIQAQAWWTPKELKAFEEWLAKNKHRYVKK